MILAVLAISVSSCTGIYRALDIDCEKEREGIHCLGTPMDNSTPCE